MSPVSCHQNIQSNGLSPALFQQLFMPNNQHSYNLNHPYQFKTPSTHIVCHGTVAFTTRHL